MTHLKLNIATVIFLIGCLSCSSQKSGENLASESQNIDTDSTEKHRLQYHFTPQSGWMNDPNGMVYNEGEYHLFYQHNPDSTVWGPMHWGHAISKDLVHWEHMPIALYPDSIGTIFSGSAVVDINNTSGFGTAENPPMIAIYTYHDAAGEQAGRDDYQSQGIAYSIDKGRTWTKYEDNPVLTSPGIKDFRDPKVMWYEEGNEWIMTLAVKDHISFYASPDLKSWELQSDFGLGIGAHGGVWECPDLFKLKVEGSDDEKWVLLVSINPGGPNGGSATQYFVGDFDGDRFVMDEEFESDLTDEGIWIDYGRDNYAGVTWSDVPEDDGRRLFMGWMSNWHYANVVPTQAWRSAMTVARALSLEETAEGPRLLSRPVEELEKLRAEDYSIETQGLSDVLEISSDAAFKTSTFEMDLDLEAADSTTSFEIDISNDKDQKIIIGYEAESQQYYIDRNAAGNHGFSDKFEGIQYGLRLASGNNYNIKVLVDVASVELFADDGKTVMTSIFFPDEEFTNIKLKATGGEIQVNSGKVYNLNSIW